MDTIEGQCAHLIYHSDDVKGLQEILLQLSSKEIYSFPTKLVPKADRTFLMACAKKGRVECCKLILSLDSANSINKQNIQGYTALHYASYEGNIEVALLLLAAGADVELLNIHNETAYETAISGKQYKLLELYQTSVYFQSYLTRTNLPVPPVSVVENNNSSTGTGAVDVNISNKNNNNNNNNNNNSTSVKDKGLSLYEASLYYMKIMHIDKGGEEKLLGCEFSCLACIQQEENKKIRKNSEQNNLINGSIYSSTSNIDTSLYDLYIGRAKTNHVCLSDLSISKQHAVISYVTDIGFILHDIGSKHGTFIEKQRLIARNDAITSSSTNVINNEYKKAVHGDYGNPTIIDRDASDIAEQSRDVGNPPYYVLKENMNVQFGRIHCKVLRRRQESVLCNSFQPMVPTHHNTTATATTSSSIIEQHHYAVEERVRVLLNLAPDVKFNTTPAATTEPMNNKPMKHNSSSNHNNTSTTSSNRNNNDNNCNSNNIDKKRKHTIQTSDDRVSDTSNHSHLSLIHASNIIKKERMEDNNIGYKILQQYGWEKDTSIGKDSSIPAVRIDVHQKYDKLGIGAYNMTGSSSMNHIYDGGSSLQDSEKMIAYKRMLMRYHEER